MSDTSKDRHVICYFGIINLCGIMDTKNSFDSGFSEVIMPLFSHESYTIKTTFNRSLEYKNTYMTDEQGNVIYDEQGNPRHLKTDTFAMINVPDGDDHILKEYQGKYYQKKFRREVLWDFGDGTTKTGYSAEHSYKKPGRYKVTCTFFDINRKAWVNDYSIYVIVKEVFPTILRFDTTKTKTDVICSKVERIAKIEALNSNTIKDDLIVNVKRIFNEEEHNSDYEEIGSDFNSLEPVTFKFMKKYWTFLENSQILFYNSDKVYSDDLRPTTTYTPKYNEIFGKFYYDDANDNMGISLYQVIPYKNIDDDLKTVKILDPNTSILSHTVENWIEVPINHVYTHDQLPYDVFSVGKRGWFDVFYRNDFIGNPNVFSIFYEIETKNITGELESATNYLNINPLGLTVNVRNNYLDDVRIGMSLDGFLRPMNGETISDSNYFIDQHLFNSLCRGIDLDVYVFPYIVYDENTDIVVDETMYYVPKDVSIALYPEVKTINNDENYSFVNHGGYIKDGEIVQYPMDDYILGIHDWFYRVPLVLRKYINIKFKNTLTIVNDGGYSKQIDVNLIKKNLINTKSVVIPKELQKKQDLNRLLDIYMAHPMFQDTPNIRDMMKAMLDNGYLSDILTTSENFLDNTANVKRCYLSNLISTLQMMGEDVTLFEKGAFEGVNELKNFVRFLTMNHTELIGHVIDEEIDITVRQDLRGKNVGEEVRLTDVLYLRDDATKDTLGKIYKIKTEQNGKTSTKLIGVDGGVDLIAHDRYTHDTKIVTFNGLQMSQYHKQKEEYDRNSSGVEEFTPELTKELSISDYDESWGWNLLLPDSFGKIGKKIKSYQNKLVDLGARQEKMRKANAKVRVYSLTQMNDLQEEIDKINREITRLKKVRSGLVEGYYTFHLLNPKVSSKRIGNFIDSEYITERLESTEDWNEVWGITHEILMKILLKNGDLYNKRGFDDELSGDYNITTTPINIKKYFNNSQDVTCNITVDGEAATYSTRGTLSITGEILDEGENPLKISLSGGVIDDREKFYILTETFDCFVTAEGEFEEETKIVSVYGERVGGTIAVTIKGSVESPQIIVIADLQYNPIVLSGDIFESSDFIGKVFNNNVLVDGDSLQGVANISGSIKGIGNNTLTISFNNVIYSRNNNTSIFPANVTGKEVNVVVMNDGVISQKVDEFEVSGAYDDGLFTGSIVTTIKGTVENPIFIIESDVHLQEYVNLLPEEYVQRTYTNNCSNHIELFTSYNGKTQGEKSYVPYYIDNFKVVFRKDENNQMFADITGTIISEVFRPETYDFTWQGNYIINTIGVPISIQPTTGDITKTDIELALEPNSRTNVINNDGFICSIEGNMLQNNIMVSLVEKTVFTGIYSILFDLDRTYERGENFQFDIQGFDEYDKVRVHLNTDAKQLIDCPYSETITTPMGATVEYIKVIVVPEHEDRNEDGEVTVIPEATYETVVFTATEDFEFNNIVTVEENGNITHEPIVIDISRQTDEFTSVRCSFDIIGGEVYDVINFHATHTSTMYLFYTGNKQFSELLVNEIPTPYTITGEYSISGGGQTNEEILFTSSYNCSWGYYDESEPVFEEETEEDTRELIILGEIQGTQSQTQMTNPNGSLQTPLTHYISGFDEEDYGIEGHVIVSGGENGYLDIDSDDLKFGYYPSECNKVIDIADFAIRGLGNKSDITGQFHIHGERVGDGYKYTITDNDSFSYKGTHLSDDSTKEVIVQYGFNKQITSEHNIFDIIYTDGETSQLTGRFSISGEVKNFTVESSNLSFKYFGNVEVWVEFDDEGNLIGADLSGLEKGHRMFWSQENLITFNYDLSSLMDGTHMFYNCSNLTSFGSKLTSLKSGYWMFKSCSLNEESLIYIADYINDISDLDRAKDDDWKMTLGGNSTNIAENGRGQIHIDHDTNIEKHILARNANKMIKKGWDVYYYDVLQEFDETVEPDIPEIIDPTNNDVTITNHYAPDASKWNEEVYQNIKNEVKIVSVLDKIAYDDVNDIPSSYDVVSHNGYVPDASTWNEQVYSHNRDILKITHVINEVAYDDDMDVSSNVIANNGYVPDASNWNEEIYDKKGLVVTRVIDGVSYEN